MVLKPLYKPLQPVTVDQDGNEHMWHLATTSHVTITLAKAKRLTGVWILVLYVMLNYCNLLTRNI